jgi:stage III sporulation protein SpoIIIAA
MTSSIIETKASGEQIQEIVNKLSCSVDGDNRNHIIMSCLAFILTLMDDDITPEEIQKGIHEISGFICTWLANATGENGQIDKMKVN